MSLKTSIVVKNGATPSLTGGTDKTFLNDGRGTNGVNLLIDSSDENIITRKSLQARQVLGAPAPNDKAFAKLTRSSISYRVPFTDSFGKVYPTIGVEIILTSHPEQGASTKSAMLNDGVAIAIDSELSDFYTKSINA